MGSYPITLELEGRPCVVIGGGSVAERKVTGLREAGARVAVIAPQVTAGIAALARAGEIEHRARPYRPGDLGEAALVIAATDEGATQRAVATEAASERVPLNVADVPGLCTFTLPAVVRRGDVTIAISTGGSSPALARKLREELGKHVGGEYSVFAALLGRLRERLAPSRERQALFTRLVESPALEWLRAGQTEHVDHLLQTLVGAECTLAALGIDLPASALDRG
jgi:precorrin-2 dehydrogenase/sirohydrochlorin ferrochelatase